MDSDMYPVGYLMRISNIDTHYLLHLLNMSIFLSENMP